jgi:outer membrane protein assembly factor BamD
MFSTIVATGVYGILADLIRPAQIMNTLLDLPCKAFRLRQPVRVALLLGAFSLFAACAGNEEIYDEVRDLQESYEKATNSIYAGNYRRGIEILEILQARYPFSDVARQIQLDLMYAYYKSGNKELAIEAADTFIRENPIHPRVDYALYIKGLAYFSDESGLLERLFRKDTHKRPPKDVEQSYQAFRRLVERYPASQYAPDSEQRMVFLKNRLAAYENWVADYYYRRGAFVAAANRAKYALEAYNGADSNAESLRIMISAYDELGLEDLAADARRVLAINFPDS